MSAFHELRAYSPLYDAEVVRLSLFDKSGGEFFALVPNPNRKGWRDRRNLILDSIDDAMMRGDPPGEVEVKP